VNAIPSRVQERKQGTDNPPIGEGAGGQLCRLDGEDIVMNEGENFVTP